MFDTMLFEIPIRHIYLILHSIFPLKGSICSVSTATNIAAKYLQHRAKIGE